MPRIPVAALLLSAAAMSAMGQTVRDSAGTVIVDNPETLHALVTTEVVRGE